MRAARFPERSTIAERLAGFLAHLRVNGFATGLGEYETAMRALGEIDPIRPSEMRSAFAAVLASGEDRYRRFGDLFDAYWLDHRRMRERQQAMPAPNQERRHTTLLEQSLAGNNGGGVVDAPDNAGDGEAKSSGEGRLAGVRTEQISKIDLRNLVSSRDLAEAQRIARDLAAAMRDRRSRRRKAARRGAMLDLRRMARRSIAHGGEPFELLRKRRPDRPVNIVAVLDVSGSMSVYAGVFLAFLRGLSAVHTRTETFLVHTRLVRVTEALRGDEGMAALGRMSLMANGFGGGTKLGSALCALAEQYGRNAVNGRTVLIVLSDGYDTDPPELVARALARLKKRGARIVWLNPLKGWAGYEPVARAMAAAMPHLDHFAAANTLDALAALEPHLSRF